MNIKIKLLSIWTPQLLLKRELDKVAAVTTECLDELLKEYAPESLHQLEGLLMGGNLDDRRALMAEHHNILVNALIESLGYGKAMELGRNALFKAGYNMGLETHEILGLNGENIHETVEGAELMYRVLGIEFKVEKLGKNMVLRVKRCALADHYSPETCRMMSAADEGVVHGLNENINMLFKKRITEGAKECEACINFIYDIN